MALDDRLVIIAPSFGATRGDAASALWLDKLDPPRIWKTFLRRIDNLDDVAMGTGGGKLGDRIAHLADRNPQVRQQYDFRQRRWRKRRRQTGAFGGIVEDRLSHFFNDVSARGRPRKAGNADPFATLHKDFGQCEGHHERALKLIVLRERGIESHRGRTVRPDPYRVRCLPFPLAHIQMIVTRRSPPVDILSRLARHEAAVLPEVLARPGAPPSVQSVNDRRRNAARFEYEPRHCIGQLAGADR